MISNSQNIGLSSTFILNADIFVDRADTGFSLHFAVITGNSDLGVSGSSTGMSISGRNGAIWDDSGNLIGGFKQGVPFNLEIHQDTGGISIFKDDIIVKSFAAGNSYTTDIIFNKSPNSSLAANILQDPNENNCVFGDDSGIFAFYYDNELFACL
jgi:hypothetical protein